MKFFASLVMVSFIGLGFGVGDAEAKRFGSGKSFGSKKMFTVPQKRTAQPDKAQAAPDKANPSAGAAAPAAGAAARVGGTAAKAGMGGGLMAGLAGLAMGGLLGAMFFGGAFENINFLDILVFGLLAFLLFKLFSGRRRSPPAAETAAPAGYGAAPEPDAGSAHQPATQARRRFDTDLLFNSKKTAGSAAGGGLEALSMPKEFDQAHFLEGAKALFARMQRAWDEKDLGDIRQFTTDKVFAEVQEQLWARGDGDNHTKILNLAASLHQVRELDDSLEASVVFDAELEENGERVTVSELWHFTKPKHSVQPTWYLDGIQQIED